MQFRFLAFLLAPFCLLYPTIGFAQDESGGAPLYWSSLPELPTELGLGGQNKHQPLCIPDHMPGRKSIRFLRRGNKGPNSAAPASGPA